jgi:hypothetical protein
VARAIKREWKRERGYCVVGGGVGGLNIFSFIRCFIGVVDVDVQRR